MTDQTNEMSQESAPAAPTELEFLKSRAKVMGIEHSNNIGVEALKEKINAKMNSEPEPVPVAAAQPNPLEKAPEPKAPEAVVEAEAPVKVLTLRQHIYLQEMKMVRVRVTNLDPKKKDLLGEVITVANEYLGTVKKFIPFGEATEDGFHMPMCIYNFLKSRTFVSITSKKDRVTGRIDVTHRDVSEFSLDIMDPLTPEELHNLAIAQAAAGSME